MSRRLVGALLSLLAALSWPAHSGAQALPRRPDLDGFIAALAAGRGDALGYVSAIERAELNELYGPAGAAKWLDTDGRPTRNVRDALAVLNGASDDGLDPADYFQSLVAGLLPGAEAGTLAPQDLARLDVALSAGMLRYLRDLHMGWIDPRSIGFLLPTPHDQDDLALLLGGALADGQVGKLAVDLRPPLAQYRLLRAWLPRYRALAANPALVPPRAAARAIRPGDAYDDIDALRRLLIALGDLSTPAAPSPDSRYQGALVEGIERFQVRHGLAVDGVIGRRTMAELGVPLAWRVRQIELALERLRWLPHLGAERFIALNIPMFRLWAWNAAPPAGVPAFGMDAIVGRALSTETPVMAAELQDVVFRPYWNVPRSILLKEVLPAIQRDPEYLRREDMEIVGGDDRPVALTPAAIAGLRAGRLRVRQRPGPNNALGLIKFVFPNRDDIYIHGTPARALFSRSRRDFSHGCVRVVDPVALAEWVLRDLPEWTRARIVAATMGQETTWVALPRPIQVFLFYTTAAVMPEDDTMRFADDIYRHDSRLEQALERVHQRRTRPVSTWTKSDAG
ncbi:MAG: L,D-transpeptidase family protein [Acidobacteria bacterium]|nr:L,D-transpeptidase family protein [Acidobacteriota bacterium]